MDASCQKCLKYASKVVETECLTNTNAVSLQDTPMTILCSKNYDTEPHLLQLFETRTLPVFNSVYNKSVAVTWEYTVSKYMYVLTR